MKKLLIFSMLSCLFVASLSAQDNAKRRDATLAKSQTTQNQTAEEIKKRDKKKAGRATLKKVRNFEQLTPDQKKVALRNKKN